MSRLRDLAAKVRAGEEVNWDAEAAAQALEFVAAGEEFVNAIAEHWDERLREIKSPSELPGLSGVGAEGSGTEADADRQER